MQPSDPQLHPETSPAAPRPVTLQDIADACQVTKATVSRALNGHPRIGQDTIDRVRAMAATMGYDPMMNDAARRLSLQQRGRRLLNHVIALFWPPHTLLSTYFGPIYQAIVEELTRLDFAVLTMYYPHSDQPLSLPRVFARGDVDGAILFGRHWGRYAVMRQLAEHAAFAGRPTLSLLEALPGASAVLADEAAGAYQSAQQLLAAGHRHLAQCIHPRLWDKQEEPRPRIMAVRQALRDANLDPDTHLHIFETASRWDEPYFSSYLTTAVNATQIDQFPEVQARLTAFLRAHPHVTAFLGINDAVAAHLWYALDHLGYRIPDDFSLVGFDDTTPVLGPDGNNHLSSVRLPLMELGVHAARRMVALVKNEDDSGEPDLLPTELCLRSSLGPAAQRRSDL